MQFASTNAISVKCARDKPERYVPDTVVVKFVLLSYIELENLRPWRASRAIFLKTCQFQVPEMLKLRNRGFYYPKYFAELSRVLFTYTTFLEIALHGERHSNENNDVNPGLYQGTNY